VLVHSVVVLLSDEEILHPLYIQYLEVVPSMVLVHNLVLLEVLVPIPILERLVAHIHQVAHTLLEVLPNLELVVVHTLVAVAHTLVEVLPNLELVVVQILEVAVVQIPQGEDNRFEEGSHSLLEEGDNLLLVENYKDLKEGKTCALSDQRCF
jgi:hypothetical protein